MKYRKGGFFNNTKLKFRQKPFKYQKTIISSEKNVNIEQAKRKHERTKIKIYIQVQGGIPLQSSFL